MPAASSDFATEKFTQTLKIIKFASIIVLNHMKIYTKTGDSGQTSLVGGTRVAKCHPRVEAYGNVDQLISQLAVVRSAFPSDGSLQRESDTLLEIQKHLMQISALLACDRDCVKLQPADPSWTVFLEEEIDRMSALVEPQKYFIIPGPPMAAAQCHVARTECRKCERSMVAIESQTSYDSACLQYINRLSDYLFALARYVCSTLGCKEENWIP